MYCHEKKHDYEKFINVVFVGLIILSNTEIVVLSRYTVKSTVLSVVYSEPHEHDHL